MALDEKTAVTEQQVQDAWDAYRALQLAICSNPTLIENAYFTALQDTANARFQHLYRKWDGTK